MASSNRFTPLASPSIMSPLAGDGAPAQSTPDDAYPIADRDLPTRRKKTHRAGKKKRTRRRSFAVLPEESLDDALRRGDGRQSLLSLHGRNVSNTSLDTETIEGRLHHHPPRRLRRPSTMPVSAHHPHSLSRLRLHHGAADEDHPEETETAALLGSANVGAGYGSHDAPPRSPTSLHPPLYDVNNPPSMPGSPRIGPADGANMNFGDVLDVMIRDDLMRRGSPSARGSVVDDGETRSLIDPAEPRNAEPSDVGEGESTTDGPSRYRAYAARRKRAKWPNLAVLEDWARDENRNEEQRVKRITEPQLINGRLRPVRKGWYRAEDDAPYRFTYFNEEFPSTVHSQSISELLQPGGTFKELFRPDHMILSDDESEEEDGEGEEEEDDERATWDDGGGGGEKEKEKDKELERDMELRHPGAINPTLNGIAKPPSSRSLSLGAMGSDSKHDYASFLSQQERDTVSSSSRTPSELMPGGAMMMSSKPLTCPKATEGARPTKPPRLGDRPVWWLDVLCPTEMEMQVLSKAFGIHPLTAEDIVVQEAREKVELFRNYYFVNYRTFDQDVDSSDYLEPVNMYVVVFREGVLSFHFSMTPHAANVRRRIRQLKDYLILSSDWISYAIIDDITDVFGPLIQNIEDEVDDIDEEILQMHSTEHPDQDAAANVAAAMAREKGSSRRGGIGGGGSGAADTDSVISRSEVAAIGKGGLMLRRVGNCRKRVMGLYRLLGNKADVIKGFAKRCNERWEVAPRSEIGLYLGDIQDHIVTMTGNLGHYEKILARSHANYLAQINIRMTARQEQTADVLGKLTVLGTIVLPMNIITGLWGMNVWVPGQDAEGDLTWFWCITAGLLAFGMGCYMVAKRVYGIV